MGEIIRLTPKDGSRPPRNAAPPPATVFQEHGWRILRVPALGQFLALSSHCRDGVMVGRFALGPDGTEEEGAVAILTHCDFEEALSRCTIDWLNADGPEQAILGSFVVSLCGRYLYWKDAILEVAAIGGYRLVRLADGCIALAREPSPVILLNPFAVASAYRHTEEFDRLPAETRRDILYWTDPRGQFGELLEPLPRA